MIKNLYAQSAQYTLYVLRCGCTLIRKRDKASVYFQPGDDTLHAIAQVDDCYKAFEEMYPGENDKVFDGWASQYF